MQQMCRQFIKIQSRMQQLLRSSFSEHKCLLPQQLQCQGKQELQGESPPAFLQHHGRKRELLRTSENRTIFLALPLPGQNSTKVCQLPLYVVILFFHENFWYLIQDGTRNSPLEQFNFKNSLSLFHTQITKSL